MTDPFKKCVAAIEAEVAHNGAGLRRLVLQKEDGVSASLQAMTHGVMKPGTKLGWHYHEDKDEIIIVLRGTARMHFESREDLELNPGEIAYIPRKTRHQLENPSQGEFEGYFLRVY